MRDDGNRHNEHLNQQDKRATNRRSFQNQSTSTVGLQFQNFLMSQAGNI
jgi:hypothetical protein